jgi:hypothetical protein
MTFGKGDHLPHRKQAAPPKAIRGRRTNKESRKQARKPKQALTMEEREDLQRILDKDVDVEEGDEVEGE